MNDDQNEREVVRLLEGLDAEEPPAGFADTVMSRVATSVQAGASPERDRTRVSQGWTQLLSGGRARPRRFLWAGAAVAIVALVIVSRYYPPDESIERESGGTIGTATQHRTDQPSGKQVQSQEPDVQAFLQSDAFERLVKDPTTRAALADPQVAALLADPEVGALLADPRVAAILADPKAMAVLADPKVAAILADPKAVALLSNPKVRAMFAQGWPGR